MGDKTGIEWTDATWNPVRGCSRVSEGCRNCYAEGVAARFSGEGMPYEGLATSTSSGPRWTGEVRLVPAAFSQPYRWKKARRIFVNSMSDLFHEKLSNEEILAVFGAMAAASWHTFQVLTKRAERMEDWFRWASGVVRATSVVEQRWTNPALIENAAVLVKKLAGERASDPLFRAANERAGSSEWPLRNVWLGVSVEDQERADERIPHLLATPAAVRFLSVEPLLGPVDLRGVGKASRGDDVNALTGARTIYHGYKPRNPSECGINVEVSSGPRVDWVIVGGESGPGARPMHLEWARAIVEQCKAASVPAFVKQLGMKPTTGYYDDRSREVYEEAGADWPDAIGWHESEGQPLLSARVVFECSDRKGGNSLDWPHDLRVREFPR